VFSTARGDPITITFTVSRPSNRAGNGSSADCPSVKDSGAIGVSTKSVTVVMAVPPEMNWPLAQAKQDQ
jgi:hypothetical protein